MLSEFISRKIHRDYNLAELKRVDAHWYKDQRMSQNVLAFQLAPNKSILSTCSSLLEKTSMSEPFCQQQEY